jgi:hypothetical protein
VAATAMWLGAPVVAHDAIFANVEGLNLLTKLDPVVEDHRAISVQLTGARRGQLRLLRDRSRRRSRRTTAPIGVLPKLIVRV